MNSKIKNAIREVYANNMELQEFLAIVERNYKSDTIEVNTLYDKQKFDILKFLFDECSLDVLEKIQNDVNESKRNRSNNTESEKNTVVTDFRE